MTLDEYLRWCGTVDETDLVVRRSGTDDMLMGLRVLSAGHEHGAWIEPYKVMRNYTGGEALERLTRQIDNQIQERLLPKNGAIECPP